MSMVTVGGETVAVPPTGAGVGDGVRTPPVVSTEFAGSPPTGPTVPGPLGELVGTRSGDKGGDATLGVWARHDDAFAWLESYLTEERVRRLVSVAADLPIERHVFPRLRAINFVLRGYLDEGAASSTRADPQAKALGEFLRARVVDLPAGLAGRGDLRSRG